MPVAVNSFEKGINRDIGLKDYLQNSYYDCRNFHVVTQEGLSSFSLQNERGNLQSFSIPDTQNFYFIKLDRTTDIYPEAHLFTIKGAPYYTDVDEWILTIQNLYDCIIRELAALPTTTLKIVLNGDTIVIAGMDSAITLTDAHAGIDVTTIAAQTGLKIIGIEKARKDVLVFTTNDNTDEPTSVGQIWKLSYNDITNKVKVTGGDSTVVPLIPSEHLIYNHNLDFSIKHRIEAVIRYDNSRRAKVYWVDNYNNLRHFNYNDDNSLATPVSFTELVADVNFEPITFIELINSGFHTSGIVQYAYQFYNDNGVVTRLSNVSDVIPLIEDSYGVAGTNYIGGTAVNEQTNKSVRLSIAISENSYEYIKVYSIKYQGIVENPIINLIYESPVNEGDIVYVTDDGQTSYGTLTEQELIALGGSLFSAKTLTIKDDRLLPANIKEKNFDIDYDARAYRYEVTNTSFYSDGVKTNYTEVGDEDDCINSYDNQYVYKYRKSDSLMGGEGPNVSYKFKLLPMLGDNSADATVSNINEKNVNVVLPEKVIYNPSFNNYASPYLSSQCVGYQRDEMYRFAIVLEDGRGRESFAKWIGDIKFPHASEAESSYTYESDFYHYPTCWGSDSDTLLFALYIEFEINNIPTDPTTGKPYKYKIVRAKRNLYDRRVVAQGVLAQTDGLITERHPIRDITSPFCFTVTSKIINFITPEANFNKTSFDDYASGSYFDLVGTFVTTLETVVGGQYFRKCKALSRITAKVYPDISLSGIDGKITPLSSATVHTFNGVPYRHYDTSAPTFFSGTCYTFALANNPPSYYAAAGYGITASDLIVSFNLKRTLSNQYKGNTYTNRAYTEYIPTGYYNTEPETDNPYNSVFGGDTFVNVFNYMRTMWNQDAITGGCGSGDSQQLIAYIPVESSINLELRNDIPYGKYGTATYRLMESAGVYTCGTGSQLKDLYLYNSVYSKQNDIKKYYPKPFNWYDETEIDNQIKASEKSIGASITDAWLDFKVNNIQEVDSRYGPINKIITWRDKVFFLQTDAIGIVAVNERVLSKTETGADLVLGTGDVLGDYGYVSTNSGTSNQFSVIAANSGLYYYDMVKGKLMQFTEGNLPLSDIKGLSAYFKEFFTKEAKVVDDTLNGIGIHGVNDSIYNRVLFTLKDAAIGDLAVIESYGEGEAVYTNYYTITFPYTVDIEVGDTIYTPNGTELDVLDITDDVITVGTNTAITGEEITIQIDAETVSYNEFLKSFESFYDFMPNIYCNLGNKIISTNPINDNTVYIHNKGNYGLFYDTYYPSIITSITNENSKYTKIFNNTEFNSLVTIADVDQYLDTFNSAEYWNSYQRTSLLTLTDTVSMKRRMRNYFIQIPRSVQLSASDDFDARMRDKYLFTKLTFENYSNRKIIVENIMTHYTITPEALQKR